ncbi:hypothetical protein [Roseateles saccharophilus]|uniref:Uncharacterized protein n=1 Tax=Roseateles saccharophilus TaxID=304 RepID=A0A4R3UBU2_ROSSA|nr:hypothetical protein [Roseateles saccharophilus]MDG0835759.1 hypothetical protein [Roseateles saccharophilus]TCU84469.1 hypothetical protein EV671_105315 [Roseateles saccharophilus]
MNERADAEALELVKIVKSIGELDKLLGTLMRGLRPMRPWQRQLLMRLEQADREVQVLRMTMALSREPQEIEQAAIDLHATLCTAFRELAGGRADVMTRVAMQLARELGNQVRGALALKRKEGN